jgi:hypothetical protein
LQQDAAAGGDHHELPAVEFGPDPAVGDYGWA